MNHKKIGWWLLVGSAAWLVLGVRGGAESMPGPVSKLQEGRAPLVFKWFEAKFGWVVVGPPSSGDLLVDMPDPLPTKIHAAVEALTAGFEKKGLSARYQLGSTGVEGEGESWS